MLDWLLLLVLIVWPRGPERTLGDWMRGVERQQLARFGRVVPTPTTRFVHKWYRRDGQIRYGGLSILGGVKFLPRRGAKVRRILRSAASHMFGVILTLLFLAIVAYFFHGFLPLVPVPVFPLVAKTWAAGAAGGWNTAANWSPSGVPVAGDDVTFNNTSVQNCTVDVATNSLNSLTVATTYTGTITENFSVSVNFAGTSNFAFGGGTWTVGAAGLTIAVGNAWQVSGGTFNLGNATVNAVFLSISGGTIATTSSYTVNLSRNDGGDAIAWTAGAFQTAGAGTGASVNLTGNSNINYPAATASVYFAVLSIAASGKTTSVNNGGATTYRIFCNRLVTGGGTVTTTSTFTQILDLATQGAFAPTSLVVGGGTTFGTNMLVSFDTQFDNATINIPGFSGYPAISIGGFIAGSTSSQTFNVQGPIGFITLPVGTTAIGVNTTTSGAVYNVNLQGFSITLPVGNFIGPRLGTSSGLNFDTGGGNITLSNGSWTTSSSPNTGICGYLWRGSTVSISGTVTIKAGDYFQLGSSSFVVGSGWTNNTTSPSWSGGTGAITFNSASSVTMTFGNLGKPEFNNLTIDTTAAAGTVRYTMSANGLVISGGFTIQNSAGGSAATVILDTSVSNLPIACGPVLITTNGQIVPRSSTITTSGPTWTVRTGSYGTNGNVWASTVIFTASTTLATKLSNYIGSGIYDFFNVTVNAGVTVQAASDNTNVTIWNQLTVNGKWLAPLYTASGPSHVTGVGGIAMSPVSIPIAVGPSGDLTQSGLVELVCFGIPAGALSNVQYVTATTYQYLAIEGLAGTETHLLGDIATSQCGIYNVCAVLVRTYYNTTLQAPSSFNFYTDNHSMSIGGTFWVGDGLNVGCTVWLGSSMVEAHGVSPNGRGILHCQQATLICDPSSTYTPVALYLSSQGGSSYFYGESATVVVNGDFKCFNAADFIDLGSAAFTVYGNWNAAAATSMASTGQNTVAFVGSSPQTISMGTPMLFYNIILQGGNKFFTQSFTCNNLTQGGVPLTMTLTAGITWTLNGTITGPLLGLLKLRSSSPGSPWLLVATRSTAVAVDVQDSNASGGATMTGTFSVDSGGNTNWVFTPAPAPLIGQACAGGTLVLTPLPPAPPARSLPATFVTQPAVFFDRCLGIYVNANGTPAKQPGT